MPIPSTKSVIETLVFDTLLLKRLQTGPQCVVLTLDRMGSSGEQGNPQEVGITRLGADEAESSLVAAVDTLISTFAAQRRVTITGIDATGWADDSGVVHGMLKACVEGGGLITVNDIYAEAISNPSFAAIYSQFMSAIKTFNDAKGIV